MRLVVRCVTVLSLIGVFDSGLATAGQPTSEHSNSPDLSLREKLPPITILDEFGVPVQVENERRWKLICGSSAADLDANGFAEIIQKSKDTLDEPAVVVSGAALRGGLFNVVFNVSGSPPAGATAALDAIAAYYELQFSDPITVTFSVSFAALSPGVLGATSSDYMNNVTYSNTRTNLVNQMDFNDAIQTFLPTGSSCPVRYNSASATITNQTSLDSTEANWAAITNVDVAGSNASITISTNFTFDYDPSNGVSGTCFRSVMIHEVGHALGFTSSVDFGPGDMEVMDLYRFQTTDGPGDYNPDDSAEFQARPRLVHNNSPDDSHHSDLMQSGGIMIEYRMSDGSPSQASHWRSQGNPGIGIMNPSIGSGITYAPNYLRTSDTDLLDALGWDYPAVDPGDLDPPTPNPMSFSTPPAGASSTSITMEATLATDAETPPVQYQFDFTSGSANGHDSSWQASRTYTDSGLLPNSFYSYRVRAGDNRSPLDSPPGPNATQYSGDVVAATLIETPVGVSFGTTDDTSIVVNADGAFTNVGLGSTGFFFEMSPPGGSGASVWVSDPTTTVTGLVPCTQYTFKVKARNFQGTETAFTSSADQFTTGCSGCALDGDMNSSGIVDGDDIAGFVRTKLGTPELSDAAACADLGNGDMDLDIAEFVEILTAP